MNRQQQIMIMLKPKVKAYGFNKKELMGVAAKIADNLTSADDASDEDVNAEIESQIEAVLPFLDFGRAYANRVINARKNEGEDNDEDDEDADSDIKSLKSNKSTNSKNKKSEEIPSWAQKIMESNEALKYELVSLKGEKVADTRRSKLEKLLKGTGTFGNRIIKNFAKMKFENDEEFDEFYSETEDDLKFYNQERADVGLSILTPPATGGSFKKEEKNEVLSDDEIKALANL